MKQLKLAFAVALASGLGAILIYIIGVATPYGSYHLSDEDLEALHSLQSDFQKCVSANGLGLQAASGRDYCEVIMKFPGETVPKWKDPKTGELEGLSYELNLCEAVATWEQVRNSTTVLTKEYIDALPNGWEDYAWRRINKGVLLNRCENRTLCMEKLSLVLPERPPLFPRQYSRCAVIGNSGDLLKTKFGDEIDSYEAVFRENGAPIQNYTEFVGTKSTFRLLNRGSAKALDKVAELYERGKEVLIVKTTIHDIMNKMIWEVPILNKVYLMLGASFGSAAKGTGLKALEFALSICDTVDMYGFTVDPGYKEWTRYFSESRQGHTPLQGRAYYQMMECLGVSYNYSYKDANLFLFPQMMRVFIPVEIVQYEYHCLSCLNKSKGREVGHTMKIISLTTSEKKVRTLVTRESMEITDLPVTHTQKYRQCRYNLEKHLHNTPKIDN